MLHREISLLALQFFTCSSDESMYMILFLYHILGRVMFIALFPKDRVSQTVLAAHQCLFPLANQLRLPSLTGEQVFERPSL